ncbi:MAG: hypothetical protein Kow0047_12840 [Anaerolineae bacterium]
MAPCQYPIAQTPPLGYQGCLTACDKRFIFFHHKRYPAEMGAPEIEAFLTHLAVKENVAAST